jgi:hypothetical protein
MERTEGTVSVFSGRLEPDAQMGLGVIEHRIEIRGGLDVVAGWHGGIIENNGWLCQDGFGRDTLWSPIEYGVHFQRIDIGSRSILDS